MSEQGIIRELPNVVNNVVASRKQIWKECHHSIGVCEQAISAGKQFLTTSKGEFPEQLGIIHGKELITDELTSFQEFAQKINTAHGIILENNSKITKLKEEIANFKQQIAKKKAIKKNILIALGVLIAIGLIIVFLN